LDANKYGRSHDNRDNRWYNLTAMKRHTTEEYYTPYQLKLPPELSVLISVDDDVCTFSEVMRLPDGMKAPSFMTFGNFVNMEKYMKFTMYDKTVKNTD